MRKKYKFVIALLFVFAAQVSAADTAPDFSLPTSNGYITLKSLKGRVVYVDFWASWCDPCRESFPWMNQMQERYAKQGLSIVAINLDKDRKLADQFLNEVPVNFKVAFDPEGKVATAYNVLGMPSSYLIDRGGNIHYVHVGFKAFSKADLEARIKSLLNK